MRIVISEFMDPDAVDALAVRFDVCYDKDLVDRPEDLALQVADAQALIVRNRTSVDRTLLGAAPRLRVVGRLGVGLDNIDVKACAARAIDVIPATGANAPAVAVTMRDIRCSMVNFDPDSAVTAPEMLKAVVRVHQNTAGVYGTVTRIGRLAVGQTVRFKMGR